ncbi:hypothetical protein H0H93_010839 [Arthromyces matolae]|nr:hypothetical protein H0H93_010839 [Arthromyces matolae]
MSTTETLRLSIKKSLEKGSAGQPKDIYEAQQWEMAGAHAMILNALLNVYEKSASIPTDKLQVWEETIYYPMFSPKFNTDSIVAEHETFHAGIENLKAYLVSCLPAGTTWGYSQVAGPHEQQKFNAAHFKSLVDQPLTASDSPFQLVQEITYLEPDALRASGLTEAEVKKIASVSESHMKSMPPTTFLVYTVIHAPKETMFPPVPGMVRNMLVPNVFYIPNRRVSTLHFEIM